MEDPTPAVQMQTAPPLDFERLCELLAIAVRALPLDERREICGEVFRLLRVEDQAADRGAADGTTGA